MLLFVSGKSVANWKWPTEIPKVFLLFDVSEFCVYCDIYQNKSKLEQRYPVNILHFLSWENNTCKSGGK